MINESWQLDIRDSVNHRRPHTFLVTRAVEITVHSEVKVDVISTFPSLKRGLSTQDHFSRETQSRWILGKVALPKYPLVNRSSTCNSKLLRALHLRLYVSRGAKPVGMQHWDWTSFSRRRHSIQLSNIKISHSSTNAVFPVSSTTIIITRCWPLLRRTQG